VLDTLKSRIRPFDTHPGLPSEVRDEALAGRVARCIEETAEEDQHQELPKDQTYRVVEQGYQRHRHCTCKVGNDAGALETQAIYDRPADDTPATTAASRKVPPVRPVLAALPVVCKTNHGIATNARTFPISEIALAPSRTRIGIRRVGPVVREGSSTALHRTTLWTSGASTNS